jgi:RNA polymerase sigma-70 factor (ECF subfamily)
MWRDQQEFVAVFNEVFPKLCRFLEILLGDRGAAQDVAQEAFLRLHRAGVDCIAADEARFWLFRVARNLALNELGKRQTRLKLIDKATNIFRRASLDPHATLEQRETKRLVRELLESLPEHQRSALLLREQEEMSYAEIGRVLNISEAKVKVDIHRARCGLREKWRQKQAATMLNPNRGVG